MTLGERNTAYDISLFQERKVDNDRNNVLKLPKKKRTVNTKNKFNIMRGIFLSLTFSLSIIIVGTMIFNQVQLTEITDKTNQVTKQLEESRSENTRLQMKVNEKLSPEVVERYAKGKLLMEKINPCQIEYFNLSTGDKVEVTQSDEKTVIDKFLALVGIR